MHKTKFSESDLEISLFVVCDQAIISKENKLSIIGIFDQIYSDKFPFNYPKMSVVGVMAGKPNTEKVVKLEIKDPSNKTVFSSDFKITLGENGKSNFISEFSNLPAALDGVYTIGLFVGDKKLGQTTFHIIKTVGSQNDRKTKVIN